MWSELMRDVCIVTAASASVERAFSILRRSFGTSQKTSLQDYIEGSVMLQFNRGSDSS